MGKISITSKNYYRLALLLPYIIWVICAAILFTTKILTHNNMEWLYLFWLGELFGVIIFSIFFWFVPYTIVIIALLIWSRIGDNRKFIIAINLSPLMLASIIWISLIMTNSASLMGWLFLAVISIVTGYIFVAIFHGLHRLLKSRNIIIEI